ncbi:glycosyltransferase [Pseudomonas stutzeri]|uniref:Glycosyl transferase family 2 n=1 Tax=Stutzerimonas stutzeri TaxID=316 RepID=A0A2N8RXV4_STUST|nr:glycosyltransferase [Stutzerimonas stutzeri]MCQ4296209.1 glycosyltransferase [Stutzerimonas stutzeri]PNF79205.1 glycosyl transferase family 2 [Stutzerimonas stutzeri]
MEDCPSVTAQHEKTIQYSLIIATLHDDGDLALCLASLVGQVDAPMFEVIVVDQNGDDRLLEVVDQFSGQLLITHERVSFRGASRARNLGGRLARGIWLGFPDDDCRLLPNALSEVSRVARDPQVQVITGQTIDEAGAPNVLRWKQAPTVFCRRTMFGCLTEATLFVRRDLFILTGGFDERFGPGAPYPAAEGIDLMHRMFEHIGSGKACYDPQIKMRHPSKIPPWNRWAVSRFHSYAIGDGALIAKNPKPHILNWGLRALVSALLQVFSFKGWKSAAFAARIVGLFKGFVTYHLASWRK